MGCEEETGTVEESSSIGRAAPDGPNERLHVRTIHLLPIAVVTSDEREVRGIAHAQKGESAALVRRNSVESNGRVRFVFEDHVDRRPRIVRRCHRPPVGIGEVAGAMDHVCAVVERIVVADAVQRATAARRGKVRERRMKRNRRAAEQRRGTGRIRDRLEVRESTCDRLVDERRNVGVEKRRRESCVGIPVHG